jgi:hypothetical protein
MLPAESATLYVGIEVAAKTLAVAFAGAGAAQPFANTAAGWQ